MDKLKNMTSKIKTSKTTSKQEISVKQEAEKKISILRSHHPRDWKETKNKAKNKTKRKQKNTRDKEVYRSEKKHYNNLLVNEGTNNGKQRHSKWTDKSVSSSRAFGIQNAWLCIQQEFSNGVSQPTFENRKEECLDIIASVQYAWNNYYQYALEKLNIVNPSHLFLDSQMVRIQNQKLDELGL